MSEEIRTRKVEVDIYGHELNRLRIVVGVPESWSDKDLSRISGKELEDLTGFYGDGWEVQDEGIVVKDQIRVVGDAPADSKADVTLYGDPNTSGNEMEISDPMLSGGITLTQLQSLLFQALKQDLLGVEIVDEQPFDENGAPRTHFSSKLSVSHLTVESKKVYVGAIHEDSAGDR